MEKRLAEKNINEKIHIKKGKMATSIYMLRRLGFPSQKLRLFILLVCLLGIYLSISTGYWFGAIISAVLAVIVFYMKG